jgi:type I restriction enzyme S subunit
MGRRVFQKSQKFTSKLPKKFSVVMMRKISASRIPKDWRIVKLGEICEINSGDTAPQEGIYFEMGEVPFVRMQHLNDLEENKYVKNFDLISKKAITHRKMKIFKRGSILLAKSGESIRTEKKAILKFDSCVVNHLAVLTVKDDNEVDNEYLFYSLKKFRLSSLLAKTTTPSINLSTLRKIEILLPPIMEQKTISRYLSLVDKAIQKTDEIIAKTERLKKGLMKELLTGRIRVEEKDGKIVFRKETEFKDTEIGKIPKDWEVMIAEDICNKITDGTHETPKPVEKGYFLVTSKHIKNGNIDFSDAYFISENDFLEINKRSKVDVGDVLFSMIGTVGMTAIVKKEYPPFAIKNVGLFKTEGNSTLAFWLYYYFQSIFAQRYINDNLKGTTQKYIPLYALRKFPIVLPSISEQQRITEILLTIDKKLELERKRKEKLERIKKGLMDLLLTGKIRVGV